MARIDEISELIIADIESKPELAEAQSKSVTAIWRLLVYVAAFFSLQLEELFKLHLNEVDLALRNLKPHKATWYQTKSLEFQYGSDLAEGVDYYDNSNLTEEEIALQKIIAQVAVTEDNGNMTVKVAKEVDDELTPLATEEYDAFSAYLKDIKDAGVYVIPLSFSADRLKLVIDVYYNPLIIKPDGSRIDGSNDAPVKEEANLFLRNGVSFDGLYIKSNHEQVLKNVDGVVVANIRQCQAARFDNSTFANVDVRYKPYAGFLRLYNDTDLLINYIEWNV